MKKLIVLAYCLATSLITAGCDYSYVELKPLPGYRYSSPGSINNKGELIVRYRNKRAYGTGPSFIYKDGKYIKLLPPGWASAEATYINDNGYVLIVAPNISSRSTWFIYREGTYTKLLPPPGCNNIDWVSGINDEGTVVAYCGYPDIGFIYSKGEYIELLPPECNSLLGCDEVETQGINNKGEVVGTYRRYGSSPLREGFFTGKENILICCQV